MRDDQLLQYQTCYDSELYRKEEAWIALLLAFFDEEPAVVPTWSFSLKIPHSDVQFPMAPRMGVAREVL